jgi:hypothetical protein
VGTLVCLKSDVGVFSILHGLREGDVAVAIVEDQTVVVTAAGRNEKTTSFIGIDVASDWGACGVDAMRPDAEWSGQ